MRSQTSGPRDAEGISTSGTDDHSQISTDHGTGITAEVAEANPSGWSTGSIALQEAVASWAGWIGLIQMTDPVGLGEGNLGGVSQPGGIPADMVTRLASDIAAQYSDKNGIQNITMKLDPAHLGKVEVQLQAKANHLSIRLMAANPESEAALRDNLKELTDAIQTRTGRFQQIEVRVEVRQSEESGRDRAEEEDRSYRDRDTQYQNGENDEPEQGPDQQRANAEETGPDLRAQGG